MGGIYLRAQYGEPKDDLKALDYFIQAIELGSGDACAQIGMCYDEGSGVAVNKERAASFWRIGALRGDICARNNIGWDEYHSGNHEIGIRHWKTAAEAGMQESLNALRDLYNADGKQLGKELISKEYLHFAFRACHEAQMEVKSEERDKHSDNKSKGWPLIIHRR